MLSVQVFFPWSISLVLSGGLNTAASAKLPKKMAATQIAERLNDEG
jgi:hypothetical protein